MTEREAPQIITNPQRPERVMFVLGKKYWS